MISILSFTAQAEINVVASVKPLHSLVSGVTEGVQKPDLIVKGAASPHTYSLKPSQAKQLEEADLVFWMGHELESFLEQPLEAIATKAKVVELIDSQGLKKLDMREPSPGPGSYRLPGGLGTTGKGQPYPNSRGASMSGRNKFGSPFGQ